MAYIKYRELTKNFNFTEELDVKNLPEYVTDYISAGEQPLVAYATSKDKFIFTDKQIILFDVRGIGMTTKKIHFLPFNSISSTALEFKTKSCAILLSMDSGYQVRLNFIHMFAKDKTKFRQIYMQLISYISKK